MSLTYNGVAAKQRLREEIDLDALAQVTLTTSLSIATATHGGKHLIYAGSSALTITLSDIDDGTYFWLSNKGSGTITLSGAGSLYGSTAISQNETVMLLHIGNNVWFSENAENIRKRIEAIETANYPAKIQKNGKFFLFPMDLTVNATLGGRLRHFGSNLGNVTTVNDFGIQSLIVNSSGSAGGGGPTVWLDELGATEGDELTFILKIRGDASATTTLYLQAKNSGGGAVGTNLTQAITLTGSVQTVVQAYTIPASAAYFNLFIARPSAGDLHYDLISYAINTSKTDVEQFHYSYELMRQQAKIIYALAGIIQYYLFPMDLAIDSTEIGSRLRHFAGYNMTHVDTANSLGFESMQITGASGGGPTFWLDELGATTDDEVNVWLWVSAGAGATSTLFWKFVDAAGSNVGAFSSQAVTHTTAAQQIKISKIVPATANRLYVWLTQASSGTTLIQLAVAGVNDSTLELALSNLQTQLLEEKLTGRIEAIEAVTNPAGHIVSPAKLYILQNSEFNFYFHAAYRGNIPWDTLDWSVTSSDSLGKLEYHRFTHTWTTTGDKTLTVTASFNGSIIASKTITVTVVSATAGGSASRKLLAMGDSLTNRGLWLIKMKAFDASDVNYALTFIGTNATFSDPALFHEGYSGKQTTHPYSDPTHPMNYSGTFDFSQYLTDNSLSMSSDDWVFLYFGTNDVASDVSDGAAQATAAARFVMYDSMITDIKAAVSGIRIGVLAPPLLAQDPSVARRGRSISVWGTELYAEYEGREAENIFVIPVNHAIDTEYGYYYETANVSARANELGTIPTYKRFSDPVHPNEIGDAQIADAVWAFLKLKA